QVRKGAPQGAPFSFEVTKMDTQSISNIYQTQESREFYFKARLDVLVDVAWSLVSAWGEAARDFEELNQPGLAADARWDGRRARDLASFLTAWRNSLCREG